MDIFLITITTFPCSLYTVLLGVVLIYWLIAIFGLVSVDLFNIDADVDADIDVDIDADIDVDVDSDIVVSSSGSALASVLMTFGLSGIPFTIVLSLILIWSWLGSFFGVRYLLPLIPGDSFKTISAIFLIIAVFIVAIIVTAICVRPFKGKFNSKKATTKVSLIGSTCEISSLNVSESYGQAILEDGGAGLILSVRSDIPNEFHKGSKAIIIGYDKNKDVFDIIAENELMKK